VTKVYPGHELQSHIDTNRYIVYGTGRHLLYTYYYTELCGQLTKKYQL